MFCTKCGNSMPDGAKFCTSCGAPMPVIPASEIVPPAAPESAPVTPEAPAPEAAVYEPAPAPEAPVYEQTPAQEYAPAPEPEPAYAPEPEPTYAPEPGYAPAGGGNVPPETPYSGAYEAWTEPPKKKSKKGLIIGLCSGVAVLAILAALFFAWIYPSYLSSEAKLDKALNLAAAALSDEDYDAAIEHYTAALSYAEKNSDEQVEALVGRGDAYMGKEKFAKAASDYEAALKIDDELKRVWGKLADAYMAADDEIAAIDALTRGVEATNATTLQERLDELTAGSAVAPAPDPEPGSQTPTDGTISIGGVTIDPSDTYISLTYLDLTDDDIRALAQCTQCEYLDLSGNYITDLSPLAGMTSLETLWADDNAVSDLTPLTGLPALEFLTIESNAITDLSPLKSMTQLRALYLYGNDIRDISPLSSLTNLEMLSLWGTPVSDISPLRGLTNLEYLDLDDTLVSDVTPLFGLYNLEALYISGDNLPDDAWDQISAALPQLADNTDFGISPNLDDGILHIGTYLDGNKLAEEDADGYLSGYDIDLGCAIGDEFVYDALLDDYDFYGYDTLADAIDGLLYGEVDILLVDVPMQNFPDTDGLRFSDAYFYVDPDHTFNVALRAGDEDLCEAVNYILQLLSDNGTLDDLYWQYLE